MADAIVYDPHTMNMSVDELGKAFAPLDYPQKDFDFQLMIAIGGYANGKGVAFPGMGTLAARLHCFKMDVKRGVDRLVKLGFLAVKKVKSKGAKWEHNVYTLAKRFLRKTVDKLAQHFDAEKWKHWVEEKCSARQRRKLVARYCEQCETDLTDAGVRGWWMAMRYVKTHVGETPAEYEAILQEAIQKYRDYDGPNYREIADRPVKPVQPAPVKPVEEPVVTVETVRVAAKPLYPEPVDPEPWLEDYDKPIEWEDVSEEDMAKMFRVFDEHPELVDDPEKAAVMAGVVFSDMKQPVQKPAESEPVDPESWLEDTVERETNLESLPANTESVSAVGSNTQPTMPAPSQTNIPANTQENVPKFINGEPSSLWRSQQLLHQINPTMYPAW